MKKKFSVILLGLGFIASVASAAPTSTIVQSLIINNLKNFGVLCLHVNNDGYVSTSTTDCGSGSGGFTTTTIAGLTSTSFNLFATTTLGISTSSPNNIYIGPGTAYLNSALTSLNGSTSSTQTFATSTATNSWKISTLNGVHTFTLPSNVSFFTNDAGYLTFSLAGGSDTQIQVNQGGAFIGNANFTYNPTSTTFTAIGTSTFATNLASTTPLTVSASSTQTANIFRVNGTTTRAAFYVDNLSDSHIGDTPTYTQSGVIYSNSQKLTFDSIGNNSYRSPYILAKPTSFGGQEIGLYFYAGGSEAFHIGDSSGVVSFNNGMQSGASTGWLLSGTNMRTTNSSAGTIRGESNSITLQGELNTANSYDLKLIGTKNGGGVTAGRPVGIFNNTNDSTPVAYFNTTGGLVLNNESTSTATGDFQVKASSTADALHVVVSTSFVGIGTSTPSERLSVDGGHIGTYQTKGATTTVSACGTGASISGTDTAGIVTVGTVVTQTTCAVNFATQYINPPVCTANDDSSVLAVAPSASTSTLTLTVASTFITADKLSYICFGK